ncbi:metal-sensing transcriptional repressor [Phaeovibrio sulfidiphilus]|uniref:Metal-sensing transcriptional repressor n=1 Tax=Phaeovibrio sulfidiphilus TaxID=1220600 RepID=A0A8J6YM27_9PROT|nr:metal-sensing transcriptional repressor [Phaeovibrio sulfidiphilus]MBE1236324.1 metal-sensing transcriptional repressor [Phaeovibrio sulfidiphilus]
MRQCMDSDNLHRRLRKIRGQIDAIDKMIDEDVACEAVLIQIHAAKNALHKVGQLVLEGHFNHCVRDAIRHGDADQAATDFLKTIEHFSRMS